jgi:hypothetical protein
VKRLTEFGGGESVLYVDTVESFKHAQLSAESSYWDFIHFDEPCPRELFIAHKRGLVDRNGKFWFNCTPISEVWINDEFCPPRQNVLERAPEGIVFDSLSMMCMCCLPCPGDGKDTVIHLEVIPYGCGLIIILGCLRPFYFSQQTRREGYTCTTNFSITTC